MGTEGGETDTIDGRYRWTCPVCGASKVGAASRVDPRQEAMNALRSHIQVGDAHGDDYEVADRWTDDELAAHVELLD